MNHHDLASYVREFLQDPLILQKGYSPHTLMSYRDTLKLFLTFSASCKKKSITELTLADLTPSMVIQFLTHLERNRSNSIKTRNIRLACIHSFFSYIAHRNPLLLKCAQDILAIPFKRVPLTTAEYLEKEEVKAILGAVDRHCLDGLRDYTLLSFMYNTGARVGEVIALRTKALQLERPFYVRITGKGAKTRLCPLWPETAELLRTLLKQRAVDPTEEAPVFVNHRGESLTRYGIRYLINKYVEAAAKSCPSLAKKRIHPHTIRHSTAMALLQSGVDINTIRAWLGHTNLETTNRYAEINLEMKRKVLNNYLPLSKTKKPWKQDKNLLQWLEAL